jgi:hypothetical protein
MQNSKRIKTSYAERLHRNGVVVVPVFDQNEIQSIVNAMREIVWPEFADQTPPLVLGGFGAFGHASSFHHPVIRNIRKQVKQRLTDRVFREYAPGFNLESMFDRLCERNASYGTIMKESWHQDVFRPTEPYADDRLFGGWVNLDLTGEQTFICVKGTQDVRLKADGFAKVEDKADIQRYNDTETHFRIPPGHAVLIQQGLIHRVNPVLPKQSSFRLFHGFRVTRDTKPLFPETETVISNLSVPRLPSGQEIPMYSPVYLMYHKNHEKLSKFSEKFHPSFTGTHTIKNGDLKGKTIIVPGQKRISLALTSAFADERAEYKYSEDDKRVLFPEPL